MKSKQRNDKSKSVICREEILIGRKNALDAENLLERKANLFSALANWSLFLIRTNSIILRAKIFIFHSSCFRMFFCIPFRRLNGQKVDYFHQSFISWICSISMCRDFFMSESIFQNISAHNQRYWSTIDSNSWYASKSPLECTYWLITIQCLTNKLVHIWAGIVTTNKKVIERFPLKPFREWWIVRNVVRWRKKLCVTYQFPSSGA